MKYKIIKYVKDGFVQDMDVTNMSTEELEKLETQGEFLCPGKKCRLPTKPTARKARLTGRQQEP